MRFWSIHSCFQWYKHYKNLPRDARVIVENIVALFHLTRCLPIYAVVDIQKILLYICMVCCDSFHGMCAGAPDIPTSAICYFAAAIVVLLLALATFYVLPKIVCSIFVYFYFYLFFEPPDVMGSWPFWQPSVSF